MVKFFTRLEVCAYLTLNENPIFSWFPKDNRILSVVHPNCCGQDIHKKIIVACLVFLDESSDESSLIQEFSTLLGISKMYLVERQTVQTVAG